MKIRSKNVLAGLIVLVFNSILSTVARAVEKTEIDEETKTIRTYTINADGTFEVKSEIPYDGNGRVHKADNTQSIPGAYRQAVSVPPSGTGWGANPTS